MTGEYEYRQPGRRPATLFGLAMAAGLLIVAGFGDAPAPVWAIWTAAAAMLVWAVLRNPVHGCRIDATRLTWFCRARESGVDLDEIAQVELTAWTDGADSCRIRLKTGAEISPPTLCLPPGETFRRVLADRGIPVTRS